MLSDATYNVDQFFDSWEGDDGEGTSEVVRKSFASFMDRKLVAKGEVTNSVEFMRVKALPRRELLFSYDDGGVQDVTPLFRKEGGTMRFRPIQSAALIEAAKSDGLFAPMSVGAGKTLVTLALPEAMDSKNAVLLVPARLKKQLGYEIEKYEEHFYLPTDRITVVSFHELSSAKKQHILDESGADLVVVDEAHSLRHRSSARTKRFLRFAKERPECRFAFLSGTMTTRSITDYAHLIELALRKNSPLPGGYREVQDWAGAIDVKPKYVMMPGALKELCEKDEEVRDGYRRRMIETPGVVATSEDEVGASLIFRKLKAPIPGVVEQHLHEIRKNWSLAGEEFDSAISLHRALRQVACGFYYEWIWPGGIPDYDWLDARAAWHKEVREKLKRAKKGMDSPLLVAQAAERFSQWEREGAEGSPPANSFRSENWDAWKEQKEAKPEFNPTPPKRTVWIDNFLAHESIIWARKRQKESTPAIIWYEHKALGEEIVRLGGFPHYGAGVDSSQAKEPVIVCSMRAQGTGMNLQHYSHNLFTSLPPNGAIVEQVTGRTHRMGQEADIVWVDWFGHTPEAEDAFVAAKEDAEYIEKSFGQPQKLVYATKISA